MSFDADAQDHIDAKIAIDGFMWPHVQAAVNRFVVGCKSDASPFPGVSNWDAFKSCCLLAGSQTLASAIVPLRGPALTLDNTPAGSPFVPTDWSPLRGVKSKQYSYLWLNINNTEFTRDNMSQSFFSLASPGASGPVIGRSGFADGISNIVMTSASMAIRSQSTNQNTVAVDSLVGFKGWSRTSRSEFQAYTDGAASTHARESQELGSTGLTLFRLSSTFSIGAEIAFYHVGDAVDMTALESRVLRYMSDIQLPSGSAPRILSPYLIGDAG